MLWDTRDKARNVIVRNCDNIYFMVKAAIILAGGKGERLRPLTDKVPKPMIDILGRPLIEYQVLWLKDQGVTHIVFSCGYKNEVIRGYFKDGSEFGLKIDYAIEETPLGRGGAFKNALKFIPADTKLVYGANGDEVIAEPLAPFVKFHEKNNATATILLQLLISPFGIVEIEDDGKVTAFREKPQLPHWINAGVYILNRSCIEMFPDVGDHETEVFPNLTKEGKLYGYKPTGFRGTVNTIKEMNELIKELPKYFPQHLLVNTK